MDRLCMICKNARGWHPTVSHGRKYKRYGLTCDDCFQRHVWHIERRPITPPAPPTVHSEGEEATNGEAR